MPSFARILVLALGLLALALPAPALAAPQLFALGENDFGELGTALDAGTAVAHRTAIGIDTGRAGKVVQVSAGRKASLVRLDDGSVLAFGADQFGQLGSASNQNPNPVPAPVAFQGTADQVSTSGRASFIVTHDGKLLSFGDNHEGQLGRPANVGTTASNPVPTAVFLLAATGGVVQVSAGDFHTLALTSTDELYAFGDGSHGALIPLVTGISASGVRVTLPNQNGRIVQIAAGAEFSLALTSTGQVYSWGDNSFGELGRDTNAGTGVPTPNPDVVQLPAGSGTPVQIAAGGQHALVLTTTGKVFAFGRNTAGELGRDLNVLANPAPTLVALPEPATLVAAGTREDPDQEDSLVLTRSGRLFGFGSNGFGEIGGTPLTVQSPAEVALPGPAASVSAGWTHTLVIPADVPPAPTPAPAPSPAPPPVAPPSPPPAPPHPPAVPKPTTPKHLHDVFALLSWSRLRNGRTELLKLRVTGLAKGDRVTLTCSGKGCPKRAVTTARTRTLALTSKVRHKQLRPGARLTITVARRGFRDSVTAYTAIAHKDPRKVIR
jgi:alpha-tubulin suppressor-like RCC1 family protein